MSGYQRFNLSLRMSLAIFCGWCLLSAIAKPSFAYASFDNDLAQGKALLRQGQFNQALDFGISAGSAAATAEQTAQTDGFLGLVHFQMRHYQQADTLLRRALTTEKGPDADRARWMATLANLEFNRGRPKDASHLYADALKLAHNDQALTANIRLGQANLLSPVLRLTELQSIFDLLPKLNNPPEQSRFLINIGSQAASLGQAGVKLAYNAYRQAEQLATGQPHLAAEALGGLAQLYEDDQRWEEALHLNDQAIRFAQTVNARELLLNLEWRKGRLHRALHESESALAAYQRAVEHIEALRLDIPVEYPDGRSSFKETLQPIYLGLADLQITLAKQQQGKLRTQLLQSARQSVESLKQSEMEDFLGGRCALANSNRTVVDAVEARTALIYPLILADRLEVLVSIDGEVRLFTQNLPATTIQSLARKFSKALRNLSPDAKSLAQQLYGWLLAAPEPWLQERQVRTIVTVPDGVLRLVPFAALYDGEHYLIERYAVANSPGLTVLDPVPLQQVGGKALLAGLSEPGPVVADLPAAFFSAVGNPSGRDLTIAQTQSSAGAEDAGANQRLKQQLRLPGVAKEIDSLSRQMPNTALLNERFTVNNFKTLAGENHYSIVHIASHGVLRDSEESSFIMAYDGVIRFNDLERLFQSEKFKEQPIQLLTLSACRTAEGDDRAPLGLSGIALKSKVRSAVGSLWPVADQATYELMVEFYRRLSLPGLGKAEALRQAQRTLLGDARFEHPYFWASFILVGNWL
ncbi:CHAT domain-containing protein [Methylomonas sp. 2BW1-5-20]|uniref:CHAT domain-containing protein n=1 Tax=Methylomonas sp. 2BW1-5-20 TaxID=3376686 RepID=UPI00405343FA